MKTLFRPLVVAFVALLIAIGCGGGGGGGLASVVGLFMTDNLNVGYDHVWATVKKVTFDPVSGASFTAYDDPAGHTIDLRTLRDASGARFSFLNAISPPAGPWAHVNVWLDKTLTLVPTGSTAGVTRLFKDFDPATNEKELTFDFAPARTLRAGTDNLCIDFDLSQWSDDGTFVTAVIHEAATDHLGESDRNEPLELHGAIGGLAGTAPDQTFNLTFGNGMTVAVQTNAQTAIFNNDGSPNPVLGNGEHVELSGTFSAPDHVFVATRIRINVEAEDGGAEVFGTPSAIDSTAHTFDITVTEAEGLVPEASTIHVVVNATSRYFRGCGLSIGIDDFFTLLAADGAKVGAEGTFDATSNTLTALRLIVVPFGSSTELAEAKGTDSNVDAVAGTFDLTLSAFEGFNVAAGSTIHIATNGSTQFFGPDGAPIDKAAFFAGLAAAASVGVQGTWDATTQTITALRAKLITAEGAGFVFVEGTSSSVDSTAHTFSATIFHWEDALLVSGETLSVVTNSSTVYKGADGVVITQDAFFAALAGGPVRVGVAGTLSGTTLTAAVARLLGG